MVHLLYFRLELLVGFVGHGLAELLLPEALLLGHAPEKTHFVLVFVKSSHLVHLVLEYVLV